VGYRTRQLPGVLSLFALLAGATLEAQSPSGFEVGVAGLGSFASPTFGGGGLSFSVRPGGDVRVLGLLAAGARRHRLTGRGELVLHYLLAPERRRGVGLYGIGGIAGISGPGSAGYLVLGVGAESSPGGRSGWLVEAGVGGGFRAAVGWRFRWLHRSAPAP
jgi:hypothetical protein